MSYLLNPDRAIDFIAGDAVAGGLVAPLVPIGLAISAVTVMEIHEGIVRSATPREDMRSFRVFLRSIAVLPEFDNRAAMRRPSRRTTRRGVAGAASGAGPPHRRDRAGP